MSTALVPTGNIFTPEGFTTTQKIAETLVKSGILPRGIDTPAKAFAVIVKGWEIGVGPMRALTGIHLIEGKPSVSPELKLERFRERGGRVQWIKSDNAVAECKFTAPNGDTHTETVTMQDMQQAGVAGKDNWRKYPKSMLRARCVAFGLRALGEGDGSYTPDELGTVTAEDGTPGNDVTYTPPAKEAAPAEGKATVATSVATATTGANTTTTSSASTAKRPGAATIPHNGTPITPDQLKKIHALRDEVGGVFSGNEEDARTNWGKALRVYRDAKGERITTSKDMSKDQASHLIDRMEGYVRKQAERMEAGVDIGAIAPPKPTMGALLDLHFPVGKEDDLSAWVHATFGKDHTQDLDKEESACALQLLLAMSEGDEAYDKAETKARALGLVR